MDFQFRFEFIGFEFLFNLLDLNSDLGIFIDFYGVFKFIKWVLVVNKRFINYKLFFYKQAFSRDLEFINNLNFC